MGIGVEGLKLQHNSPYGVLRETTRVVLDAEDNEVTEGVGALPGSIEDYRISEAEGTNFSILFI